MRQAAEDAYEGTWITTIYLLIPLIAIVIGEGSKWKRVVGQLKVIERNSGTDVGARPAGTKGLAVSTTSALRRETADS